MFYYFFNDPLNSTVLFIVMKASRDTLTMFSKMLNKASFITFFQSPVNLFVCELYHYYIVIKKTTCKINLKGIRYLDRDTGLRMTAI